MIGIGLVVSRDSVAAGLAHRILQSHLDNKQPGKISHGKQQKHEYGQNESELQQTWHRIRVRDPRPCPRWSVVVKSQRDLDADAPAWCPIPMASLDQSETSLRLIGKLDKRLKRLAHA